VGRLPEVSAEPARGDYRITVRPDASAEHAIYVVRNGRLLTDCLNSIAVINERNKLVSGASWQWGGLESGILKDEENAVFAAQFSARPKPYTETVFSLWTGGGGDGNLFHWLFDALPRLHLLQLSGLRDQPDLFAVPWLKFPFQRQSLSLLGLSDDRFIESRSVPHVKAKKILATDHPRGNTSLVPAWICKFLRQTFLALLPPPPVKTRRIYLSRNDSLSSRRIVNEPDLVRRLSHEGFTSVTATDFSFAEQASLFHNAEIIVSPHGAGLSNLVFCRPGTRVIEIFSSAWWLPMFEAISSHLNLAYSRFAGSPSTEGSEVPRKALKTDIRVDVDKLFATVEALDKGFPVHSGASNSETIDTPGNLAGLEQKGN